MLLHQWTALKRVVLDAMSVSTGCCVTWYLLILFEGDKPLGDPTEIVYAIMGDSSVAELKGSSTTIIQGDLSVLSWSLTGGELLTYDHPTIQNLQVRSPRAHKCGISMCGVQRNCMQCLEEVARVRLCVTRTTQVHAWTCGWLMDRLLCVGSKCEIDI